MQTGSMLSRPLEQEQRQTRFFSRVGACDTYDRLNDEIAEFGKAIDDNWGNEQDVSCLWESVIRRLRGISSKYRHLKQNRSFFHYPAIARLVVEMAHNMTFFNLYSLSYVLSDLAYTIKHDKNAGLSFTGDSEAAQSIHKLFSDLPDYIRHNFTDYCVSDNRDASGCLGRLYTAIVIAKPLNFLEKPVYLTTEKMLIERLSGIVGSIKPRVVREAIWCISKGISQEIYRVGLPFIKTFLDNLLRCSEGVVDGYNIVDLNVVIASLLKLLEHEEHVYLDKILCVQHIDLITGSLSLRELENASEDDLWAILHNLIEIKKHLPLQNEMTLMAAFEKLVFMSKNKMMGVVSVCNNDHQSLGKILGLLRDISDKKFDKKVYFWFFDAFYNSFLGNPSRPVHGWPVWHLDHLYRCMNTAFDQYLPSFQGNERMVSDWKNFM